MEKEGRTGAVVDLGKVDGGPLEARSIGTLSLSSCEDEVRVREWLRTKVPSFVCASSAATSGIEFERLGAGEVSFLPIGDSLFLGGDPLSTAAFASLEVGRPSLGDVFLLAGLRSLSTTACESFERPVSV